LTLEHGTGRVRHLVVVVVEHVGQHQRGALEPGRLAQARQVRLQDEVAIPLVPARGRISRHRLHVDVVGEQIVAGVRLRVRAIDEIAGFEALTDQSALHVDHRHEHCVDGAGLHRRVELIEAQVASHGAFPRAHLKIRPETVVYGATRRGIWRWPLLFASRGGRR